MKFRIVRSKRRTISLEVKEAEIIVRAPYEVSVKDIDAFVNSHRKWIDNRIEKLREQRKLASQAASLSEADIKELTAQAKKVIPERVAYYAPLVGVTYGTVTIRKQKTRWGSCSAKGNLNFNCLLMLAPPEVIDSVVVHELCHRKEMNHSKRFYDEIHRVFPAYKKWDRWLKENGQLILMRVK